MSTDSNILVLNLLYRVEVVNIQVQKSEIIVFCGDHDHGNVDDVPEFYRSLYYCSKSVSFKRRFQIIRIIHLEDIDAIRVYNERKLIVGREYSSERLISVENTRTYFRHVQYNS